jgi:hypothetical protein
LEKVIVNLDKGFYDANYDSTGVIREVCYNKAEYIGEKLYG